VSLPMFPQLKQDQLHEVAKCVKDFAATRVS
jgi:hypothetical protein